MTQRKTQIERYSAQIEVVSVVPEHGEVSLGDLRKLVAAAVGMPDNAEVWMRQIESHYGRTDTYVARVISVESEATQ